MNFEGLKRFWMMILERESINCQYIVDSNGMGRKSAKRRKIGSPTDALSRLRLKAAGQLAKFFLLNHSWLLQLAVGAGKQCRLLIDVPPNRQSGD